MTIDKNLTLFIPTKNRPSFIKRISKYYSDANFTGKILIGDSSDTSIYKQNKLTLDNLKSNLDVQHFYLPGMSSGHACAKLASHIRTEFAAQINDDDILVQNNINKSLKLLKNYPDISGVNGKALLIGIKENTAFGDLEWIKEYKLCELDQDNPYERVNYYLKNPENLNLSIFRSKYYHEIYDKILNLSKINSYYEFEEIIHGVTMASKGKIIQKNYLSNIRQGHDNQLYHSVDIYDWITDENWQKANLIIKELVMENFKNYSNKTELENLNEFKKIFLKRYSLILNASFNKLNKQNLNKKDNTKNIKQLLKKLLIRFRINKKNKVTPIMNKKFNRYVDELNFFTKVIKETNE